MRRKRTISSYLLLVIILACVTVFCASVGGLSYLALHLSTHDMYEQQAAGFYRSEVMPYVQLSCFIDEDAGFDLFSIESLREKISAELTNASISAPEGSSESARLYIDAYSLEYSDRAATPDDELLSAGFDVTVSAVGGEFFRIHRPQFISGQAFSDGDFLTDRVVLDELCAWRLYGASDITGMNIMLGGKRYEIAGVVKTADYESYGITPRVYIPYAAHSPEGNTAVTCYEAVLPEQITGFGESTLTKSMGLDKSSYVLKNNTKRYEITTLLEGLDGFFARGTRTDRIYYPHWENNALTVENFCTVYALVSAVSLGISAAAVIIMAMASMLRLSRFLGELKERRRRL